MNALEVKNLSKSFRTVKAVNNVSFAVPENSIFGLIGRNGAGKTTTIRMLMNIYQPDNGETFLRGSKIGEEFKSKVGYLPEERGLYKKMKVLETLLYFAELKGKSAKDISQKAMEYLERFDLKDRANSKIEDLSKGNQQKIQFITSILHDPEFLILDEPFSGLDPINTSLLTDIIIEMKKKGKVIILSTHLMDFAERLCDNIAMIDKGNIILNGRLNEIKSKYANKNITIAAKGDVSFLNSLPFVESVENFGNTMGIKVNSENDIQLLLKALTDNNLIVTKFDANTISLHEILFRLGIPKITRKRRSKIMNINNIITVIKRELRDKLYSKAFVFMTLLIPGIMILSIGVQSLFMSIDGDEGTKIQVISQSAKISDKVKEKLSQLPFIKNNYYKVTFLQKSESEFNDYYTEIKPQLLADSKLSIIYIPDSVLFNKQVKFLSKNPINNPLFMKLKGPLNEVFVDIYFEGKELTKEEIDFARLSVDFEGLRVTEDAKAKEEGFGNLIISFVFTFLLYISLLLLGQLMMRAVVEEKNNRIVEIILSSIAVKDLGMQDLG